jgi:hypothetical protein
MKRLKASRRHDPFEIILSIVFGISAALQTVTGPPPGSTAATLSPGFRNLWLALVIGGAMATLVGVAARRNWGYLVEEIGLAAMGGALVAFGAQVLELQVEHHTLSPATVLGGPLTIALGAGFYWKWFQVWRTVADAHIHIHSAQEAE